MMEGVTPAALWDSILDEIYHPANNPGGGLFVRVTWEGVQIIIDAAGTIVIDEQGNFLCDCCPLKAQTVKLAPYSVPSEN